MEVGAQKDGGGPNVFMREALNLIDFFEENYKITQNTGIDDDSSSRSSSEDVVDAVIVNSDGESSTAVAVVGDEEASSSSSSSSDSIQAVTASGIVPDADLAGMYKHYLITRLAERDDALRQRYADVEPSFATLLGITKESQGKIKQSLAFSAYKNMLVNLLQYKGIIEPQDVSQFIVLKESLQLSKEVADKVYDEATKGAVVEHAARLIRDNEDGRAFTPAIAKTFREQVHA